MDKKSADEFCEELKELFDKLRDAAADMDIDALDQIGGLLESYEYTKEQQKIIGQIQTAIVNFDIDYLQNVENL